MYFLLLKYMKSFAEDEWFMLALAYAVYCYSFFVACGANLKRGIVSFLSLIISVFFFNFVPLVLAFLTPD